MTFTERASFTKSSFQIPAPSENALLAIIAGAFLVLHVAAGIILQRSLPADAIVTFEAKPSFSD